MREPTAPSPDELRSIVEAILFAHDGPVTDALLVEAIPGIEPADVQAAVATLAGEYDSSGRSFEIVRVAGGYQICTREQWADWVVRFERGKRRVRLSRAAVETLGIVAYRQPVTRGEIEDIRGVDTGGVIHTLLERDLIGVKGRAKTVGRPLLYVTTEEFLEYFGLDSLNDLPRLEEIEELLKDRADIMEEIEEVAGPPPDAEADSAAAEGEDADAMAEGEDADAAAADEDADVAAADEEDTDAAAADEHAEQDSALAFAPASALVPVPVGEGCDGSEDGNGDGGDGREREQGLF